MFSYSRELASIRGLLVPPASLHFFLCASAASAFKKFFGCGSTAPRLGDSLSPWFRRYWRRRRGGRDDTGRHEKLRRKLDIIESLFGGMRDLRQAEVEPLPVHLRELRLDPLTQGRVGANTINDNRRKRLPSADASQILVRLVGRNARYALAVAGLLHQRQTLF